ncbi:efflux RND transporter periplasmic adaptor subunit [Pelomonas sp. P7]|uniref:Efflux RND transporter periplasmic adaptor subunit n=2 Tax=Pelomonas caseinilytica TaxID=2906763 RepID=A0ABS8XC31_9BURK|nr:efflux RND transporter periplasmic adaptor subunit [Pelomonas sp. P7]
MTIRPALFPSPLRAALSAGAVLVLTMLAACNGESGAAPAPAEAVLRGQQLVFPAGHPQLRLLKLAPARPGEAVDLPLSAKLVWNEDRTQRIYPAFAGRVDRIAADVGQAVKAGQVLAELASPDFGAAQADAARAEADRALTAKQLQRQRELLAAGIVAQRDAEQAEADAARAEAELARARARVRMYGGGAGVNQQLALRAGVAGTVVERNLNPGQELRPDQSGPGVPPLFVISDPASLWVQIDARESEVDLLRPGSTFELELAAYPGRRFEGRVAAMADVIDPATRTVKVRGQVANADRLLKAEMLATAHLQRRVGEGVVVPVAAVLLRGDRHWVFVSPKPGVFEPREVEPEAMGAQQVVLRRGLEVGEQVVVENALLLERQLHAAEAGAKAGQP